MSEAVHNGHWTENIQQDGVVTGTMASLAEAGVATWNNDVVGTIKHIGTDITHPAVSLTPFAGHIGCVSRQPGVAARVVSQTRWG